MYDAFPTFDLPLGDIASVFQFAGSLAGKILPIALIAILAAAVWRIWLYLIRMETVENTKWSLLEIRIPKDVFKSPLAMEIILVNGFSGGGDNWYEKYVEGALIPWHSLEIVSIEGNVHFFIRTPAKNKNIAESQIYSQYPDAEVVEVEDYTNYVPLFESLHGSHETGWDMFGAELVLSKDDPYPIRTYPEYGLDKAIKKDEEDTRIDPLTPLIEHLGTLGKGEQGWVQIVIRKSQKQYRLKNGKTGDWVAAGKELAAELLTPQKAEDGSTIPVSKSKQDAASAIERSIEKTGFDCGIRLMYVAEKDKFKSSSYSGIRTSFRHYTSSASNGFSAERETKVDYPFADLFGIRAAWKKRRMFKAYKLRSFFHQPYRRPYFVMSSEELATIYHFPGRISAVPTLVRMDSMKADPPANLPL